MYTIRNIMVFCLLWPSALIALVLGAGCATEPDRSHRTPGSTAPSRPGTAPAQPAPSSNGGRRSSKRDAEPKTATARLPDGLEPGRRVVLQVPRDRSIHVVHGVAKVRRAFVYLHGVCGDVTAIDVWAKPASRLGTVVALQGDAACENLHRRYRWSQYIPGIDARIDRALARVESERNGLLETTELTIMGYSQGATRAAALAQRYPEKYPRLVVAGIPVRPTVSRAGKAKAVAIIGGEREPTDHMRGGVEDLVAAGKAARFFLLPGAGHGQYGPEGARVLDVALRYVLDRAP